MQHLTKGKCDTIFSGIRQRRTGCVAALGDTLCPRLEITSIKQYMRSRLVVQQLDQPLGLYQTIQNASTMLLTYMVLRAACYLMSCGVTAW